MIHKVRIAFLQPLFSKPNNHAARKCHVKLKSTLLNKDKRLAEKLNGVFFGVESTHRASWQDLARDTFVMRHKVGSDNTHALKPIIDHLHAAPDAATFVFGNTKTLVKNATVSMESKLDKAERNVDVMRIDGNTSKRDKFGKINLFCKGKTIMGYKPQVVLSTLASNQGVEHPNAQYILNLEWPNTIATWTQRMGRAARAGQPAVVVIIVGITGYTVLVALALNYDDVADNATRMSKTPLQSTC